MAKPVDVSAEWNKIEQLGDEFRSMKYDMFVPKSKADMESYKWLIGRSERRINRMAKEFLQEKGFTNTGRDRKTGVPSNFVPVVQPAPVRVADKPEPKPEPKADEMAAIRAQLEKMKALLKKP